MAGICGQEYGRLGISDPGLVCEQAGINTFLRTVVEKEGTICSRVVGQRIEDNRRLRRMGCEAGIPAAPANKKRRKREAKFKGSQSGMVDRVVRTLAGLGSA